MTRKEIRRAIFTAAVGVSVIGALVGCDKGEFRSEEIPPKADIEKQIDMVKKNPNIPPGAKPQILAGLEQQLKRAK